MNIPGNPCLYSENESVYLQHPLDDSFIGEELGQFKLEGVYKKAYFVSPRLYCLIDQDGKEIIRSKGVKSHTLSEGSFINLLNGNKVIK